MLCPGGHLASVRGTQHQNSPLDYHLGSMLRISDKLVTDFPQNRLVQLQTVLRSTT